MGAEQAARLILTLRRWRRRGGTPAWPAPAKVGTWVSRTLIEPAKSAARTKGTYLAVDGRGGTRPWRVHGAAEGIRARSAGSVRSEACLLTCRYGPPQFDGIRPICPVNRLENR